MHHHAPSARQSATALCNCVLCSFVHLVLLLRLSNRICLIVYRAWLSSYSELPRFIIKQRPIEHLLNCTKNQDLFQKEAQLEPFHNVSEKKRKNKQTTKKKTVFCFAEVVPYGMAAPTPPAGRHSSHCTCHDTGHHCGLMRTMGRLGAHAMESLLQR